MKIEKSHLVLMSLFSALFAILVGILIVDSAGAENNKTSSQSVILVNNLTVQPQAQGALFLSSEIIFPEINTEFSFNGLGLKWQYQNGLQDNCSLFIKTEKTDWMSISTMDNSNPQNSDYLFSDPLFLAGQKINFKANCKKQVNSASDIFKYLQIIYFDSKPSYYFTTLNNIKNTSRKILGDNNIKIISRSEWGADESYRFWQPQYSEPKAFVIHHTAGGNGGDDPAATVRGIYYWHAVVLGWGDIGYNYLIDPAGNIYEGRYGGDDVIGAHTYNNIEDVNYNEGTIGISILGCYEADQPGCDTVNEYTAEIQESLKNLIASKAKKLDIKLSGDRTIFSRTIKSIVGHQDLDYTLCPGSIIEESLPEIRDGAKAKYDQLIGRVDYRAKLISESFAEKYFLAESNNVAIIYKNKGKNIWLADSTYLKYNNEKIYLSQDVAPGEDATFNLIFTSGEVLGQQNITLELYQAEQYIYKSRKKITVQIIKSDQAQFITHNLPAAILRSWEPNVQFIYQNTGKVIWQSGDVKLFVNGDIVADLSGKKVLPGDNATFNFILKQKDLQLGNNELVFYLKNGDERIGNSRYIRILRVDE